MMLRFRSAGIVALTLALSLGLGCKAPSAPAELASGKPLPSSSAQAVSLRATGNAWTNAEIRAHYLVLVAAIGPANEAWKREGLGAEERAHRAYEMRHDARVTCRAMMSDPRQIMLLEQRDQKKYGHPDGPRFDELVAQSQSSGLTGDAVFEAIVASAQRTNSAVNEMVGL
jgi:hypothetical protein